jgi:hypothetical protein
MNLTSFIHRRELLDIAERWFWGRPAAGDALKLTKILICDGYVIGETLRSFTDEILRDFHSGPFRKVRIKSKGELRDAISRCTRHISPRVEVLRDSYRKNPDYFYYETPINGVLYIDDSDQLIASYRIKRPKRIAEKANRRIASWILKTVQEKARTLARTRAVSSGVPLDRLMTPEAEMLREFVEAEESIASSFREGTIRFDRAAITINDVGGIKVIGDLDKLEKIEDSLRKNPSIRVLEREDYHGKYEAASLILNIPWDADDVCGKYRDSRSWEKYLNRGIPESELKKGLEPLLENADPRINIELIFCTFEAMVESELGNSIHEERIITQRDNRLYKGYLPMNVEFLLEYLFAVGFSPEINVEPIPIKLWGRYLPDTLVMYIRRLYRLPEYDLFY